MMYDKLPYMIYGFHGCDQTVKDEILKSGGFFKTSSNSYDWLGKGIYFWENDYQRAIEFAEDAKEHPRQSKGTIKTPAVLGAVIDLGYCLNLLNRKFIRIIEYADKLYVSSTEANGDKVLVNRGELPDMKGRYRDCAVINNLHTVMQEKNMTPFDTVRSAFFEGGTIYENAGFYKRTHIQICVRNPNCIKAVFDPREYNDKYRMP